MALTQSFIKALEERDILLIRIMLKDSLLVDRSFDDFHERMRAVSKTLDVFEKHDGRELIIDESNWTELYIDQLMAQLVTNFSKERLNHLKKVIGKVYPFKEEDQNQKSLSKFSSSGSHRNKDNSLKKSRRHPSPYQEQKSRDKSNGSFRGYKIAGGMAAGAAIGSVIGVAASTAITGEVIMTTAISMTVVGAIAGGAAVFLTTDGESNNE